MTDIPPAEVSLKRLEVIERVRETMNQLLDEIKDNVENKYLKKTPEDITTLDNVLTEPQEAIRERIAYALFTELIKITEGNAIHWIKEYLRQKAGMKVEVVALEHSNE